CPQYLMPIPCATTVQFTSTDPRRGTQHLPIGTRLNSVPVFGTSCTFHSSYETSVHPITLESVRQIGRSLRLNFQLEEGARFDELDLKRLRLHLHGHPRYMLYLGLSRYIEKLTAFGDADREPIAFTQDNIEPVGFEEKLLPDPTPSFAGLGLLSEYFVFPDQFMYVEIVGLEALRGKVAQQFELQIEFDRDFDLPIFIDPDQIRLNCTPAVNRFPMDSRPIEVDGTRLEYPIVVDVNLSEPSMDGREHYKIYSVDRVLAWAQETLGPRKYEPFYSFKHGFVRRKDTVYYQTHLRGRSPTISFVPSGDGVPAVDEVSLKLTCSNGRLPEHLRLGSISGEMPDVE
ncbi:MAG: type VI secretion system baseplate subunit TssF, partial [Bacteroidota bacterium]